jgi:GntR family transcriptional regulator
VALDPRSDRPLYRQLADERRRIVSGELPPGSKLPSETTLGQEYGLAMPAIRSAINVLRSEGLVTTERGFGTKVRVQPEREVVELHAGDRVTARAPIEDERRQFDMDPGVPVIVVNQGSDERIYPADRVELSVHT